MYIFIEVGGSRVYRVDCVFASRMLQGLAVRGRSAAEWSDNIDAEAYKIQRLWSAGRRRWRDTKASPNDRLQSRKKLFQYWEPSTPKSHVERWQMDICHDGHDQCSPSSDGATESSGETGASSADSSFDQLDQLMFNGFMTGVLAGPDAQPNSYDDEMDERQPKAPHVAVKVEAVHCGKV